MQRHMGQRVHLKSMKVSWRRLSRLRELALVAVCCATIAGAPVPSAAVSEQRATPKQYQFTNGWWFDGEGFQRNTFYVVDGLLTRTAPARVDEVIDLHDGFVVPPFGEAHNHNVEGAWNIDAVSRRYLEDGVFYVKNPNSIRQFTAHIADKVNTPTSVDVVFAHAGLTSTGGHPVALYEQVLRDVRYRAIVGDMPPGWFNHRGYELIDSEADLAKQWSAIAADTSGLVKVFVAHTEDAGQHHSPGQSSGRHGLDPTLLPGVVARAHASGLRVSAHVETAADFRLAVSVGADELAHVPGWFLDTREHASRMTLTVDDARLAAEAGVIVTTTTVAMQPVSEQPGDQTASHHHHGHHGAMVPSLFSMKSVIWQLAQGIQRHNLRLLHRYGVPLAIGSDHAETSVAEALHLHELGIFDNRTLLKLWCENTPKAIFPDRRIGRFLEGYEASFLVLAGNPIEQFDHVMKIVLRVKQGHILWNE